ncbi:hypothetical protein AB1Y20_016874 [Prymnesium parvum]|uniref:Uncharacterized protein n=1 Tax=Prymnesium parvum TaxID=97485 RepID=A0AB34ICF0_PRYPA
MASTPAKLFVAVGAAGLISLIAAGGTLMSGLPARQSLMSTTAIAAPRHECPRSHPLLVRNSTDGDTCRSGAYPDDWSFECPHGCIRGTLASSPPHRLCAGLLPQLPCHARAPQRGDRETGILELTSADFQLVLSFCREPLAWTHVYRGLRVIYSKCGLVPDVAFAPGDELSFAPNRGREGETIVRYVVDHYAELPRFLGFAHAGLNDESDRGHSWIRNGGAPVDGGRVRGKDYGPRMYFNMLRESMLYGYSTPHEADQDQEGDWGLSFSSSVANAYSIGGQDNGRVEVGATVATNLGHWFALHNWTLEPKEKIKFYPSAVFALNSNFVTEMPLSYYQALQSELNYTVNPLEGHYFERSWFYVFALHHRNKLLLAGRLPSVVELSLRIDGTLRHKK